MNIISDNCKCKVYAFTLAEMMVVMLILTIVLAAFAPMMTKRKTIDITSPWRYASNNSDAYFGLASTQSAMLGQNEKNDNDYDAKLIIKTLNSNKPYISFRDPDVGLAANLKIEELEGANGSFRFGGPYSSNATGSGNTGVGLSALRNLTSGSSNTAFGYAASRSNTTGVGNTALGDSALYSNTAGRYNTALGTRALYSNSGAVGVNNFGYANTAVGYQSLSNNTLGYSNTAIGYQALNNATIPLSSTAVGYQALSNATGSLSNTAMGYRSMSGVTNASYNTAYGTSSLLSLTTGTYNTAVGMGACRYVTTGSNKTCIGHNSGPSEGSADTANDANILYLGTSDTIVHIPGRLVVDGSVVLARRYGSLLYARTPSFDDKRNVLALVRMENDDTGWRSILKTDLHNMAGEDFVPSDRRLKNIGSTFTAGLNKIRELKIYNYTYKKDETKYPQVGVIAQDLQKVFPTAVTKDDEGYLRIRLDEMFYAMVNSIKQLDVIVQNIVEDIKTVFSRLDKYDEKIQQLEEENKLLKEQIQQMNKRLENLEEDD